MSCRRTVGACCSRVVSACVQSEAVSKHARGTLQEIVGLQLPSLGLLLNPSLSRFHCLQRCALLSGDRAPMPPLSHMTSRAAWIAVGHASWHAQLLPG